jgi:hypothetical protein
MTWSVLACEISEAAEARAEAEEAIEADQGGYTKDEG